MCGVYWGGGVGSTTFEEIVERYAAQVYRAACFDTSDEALAEDVVQEVFTSAYQNLEAIRQPQPWLIRVTRNKALNALRSRTRAREVEMPHQAPEHAAPDPQELYDERDIVDAIRRLPFPLREVIVLRYYEGLEPHEIARQLGMLPGTVRSRLLRARSALRSILAGGGDD